MSWKLGISSKPSCPLQLNNSHSHRTAANSETLVVQYHVTDIQDLIIYLLLYILRASLHTKWIALHMRNGEQDSTFSIYDSYFFSDYHILSYSSTFEVKDSIFIIKAWWFWTVLSPKALVFSCKHYQSTAIQINPSLGFLQCHFNLYILFLSVQCYIFFILWDTAQQWARFQLTYQIYSRLQLEWPVKVFQTYVKMVLLHFHP